MSASNGPPMTSSDAVLNTNPTNVPPTDPKFSTIAAHAGELGPSTPDRGRQKSRRPSSSHRSPSPSRGHHRSSGSRHRQQSSPVSVAPSPHLNALKETPRRRSDAEPDHTLRGRARLRSRSRSPAIESESEDEGKVKRRKRSKPPSRSRKGADKLVGDGSEHRRQRSLPNIYNGRNGHSQNQRQ